VKRNFDKEKIKKGNFRTLSEVKIPNFWMLDAKFTSEKNKDGER